MSTSSRGALSCSVKNSSTATTSSPAKTGTAIPVARPAAAACSARSSGVSSPIAIHTGRRASTARPASPSLEPVCWASVATRNAAKRSSPSVCQIPVGTRTSESTPPTRYTWPTGHPVTAHTSRTDVSIASATVAASLAAAAVFLSSCNAAVRWLMPSSTRLYCCAICPISVFGSTETGRE